MMKPFLVIPAIYVTHVPTLKKRVRVHRINDNLHVQWRLPIAVGCFIARRKRV